MIKIVVLLALFCLQVAVSQTDIRLAGGDSNNGVVEVNLDGTWGTICSNGFSIYDAKVVCREVTGKSSAQVVTGLYKSDERIIINDLHCTGSETSWKDCTYENKPNACDGELAAEVSCNDLKTTGTLGAEIGIIAGIVVVLVTVIGIAMLTVGCLWRNQCCRGRNLA